MDTSKIRTKLSQAGLVKKSTTYFKKHQRFAPLVSFVAGFSWDSFTLKSIDLIFDNLLLYIILLEFAILLIQFMDRQKIQGLKINRKKNCLSKTKSSEFFYFSDVKFISARF